MQATSGEFYGTAKGQLTDFGTYIGTVFRISPSGTLKRLHEFCSQPYCEDGYTPYGGLVQAADGNLYGTASEGGDYGIGTIFEMTPAGTLTTVYSFCDCGDGAYPYAGLVQATDGNFYGTTYNSANDAGTIYVFYPAGSASALHVFSCPAGVCTEGANPQASLVQHTNGNFYGTTVNGGANNAGTVFSLSTGLGPFVKTEPTTGNVGAAVTILGTHLGEATSVAFNGAVAAFQVISSSEITTTVPAGATTGTVQVVTPSGPLSSNVPFRVKP